MLLRALRCLQCWALAIQGQKTFCQFLRVWQRDFPYLWRYLRELGVPSLTMQEEGLTK